MYLKVLTAKHMATTWQWRHEYCQRPVTALSQLHCSRHWHSVPQLSRQAHLDEHLPMHSAFAVTTVNMTVASLPEGTRKLPSSVRVIRRRVASTPPWALT